MMLHAGWVLFVIEVHLQIMFSVLEFPFNGHPFLSRQLQLSVVLFLLVLDEVVMFLN